MPAGVPDHLVITQGNNQTATINTDFGDYTVVKVVDSTGAPVPSVTVHFSIPSSAQGTFNGTGGATFQDVVSGVGVTAGYAGANIVHAGGTWGTWNLSVSVPSVPAVPTITFSMTNYDPAPRVTTITITAGSGQAAPTSGTFGSAISFNVKDQYGSNMSGININVSTPGSGASCTFGGLTSKNYATNSSGNVTTDVPVANATVGTYNVTIGGGLTVAHFQNLSSTPSATTITITAGGGQSAAINVAFASAITVNVKDQFGANMNGANVTFAAPATSASCKFSGAISQVVATNASGNATSAVPVANAYGGAYYVTISVGTPVVVTTFTNVPSAGASVCSVYVNPANFSNPGGGAGAWSAVTGVNVPGAGTCPYNSTSVGSPVLSGPLNFVPINSFNLAALGARTFDLITQVQVSFNWVNARGSENAGVVHQMTLGLFKGATRIGNDQTVSYTLPSGGSSNVTTPEVFTWTGATLTGAWTVADITDPTFTVTCTGRTGYFANNQINSLQVKACFFKPDLGEGKAPLHFCEW